MVNQRRRDLRKTRYGEHGVEDDAIHTNGSAKEVSESKASGYCNGGLPEIKDL